MGNALDTAEQQERINSIQWYHEFDFPNGLKARAAGPDVADHRRLWNFIQRQLDDIDFAGRSVLDIGCWDGYWSFYAEKRGAARVLATDDQTQNWAGTSGLLLARELLGSAIETRLDTSVYELDRLTETFDVILCLGVYYHLIDPFYAFAQIRQRCHQNTIVIFEGDVTTGMRPDTAYIDPSDHSLPIFVPTTESLNKLLKAAYLGPESQSFLEPVRRKIHLHWRDRLRGHYREIGRLPPINRAVTVCRPFQGNNDMHRYKPPFGLASYDDRFRAANA
jgi:tRNA (mo5U34)-methyltransferase